MAKYKFDWDKEPTLKRAWLHHVNIKNFRRYIPEEYFEKDKRGWLGRKFGKPKTIAILIKSEKDQSFRLYRVALPFEVTDEKHPVYKHSIREYTFPELMVKIAEIKKRPAGYMIGVDESWMPWRITQIGPRDERWTFERYLLVTKRRSPGERTREVSILFGNENIREQLKMWTLKKMHKMGPNVYEAQKDVWEDYLHD